MLALMARWEGPFAQNTASILGIAWMMISIPVAIVTTIDWYRSAPSTGARGAVRNLLRIPIFLLGAVCMIFGVIVVVWVLYLMIWRERNPFSLLHMIHGVWVWLLITLFGFSLTRLSLRIGPAEGRSSGNVPIEQQGAVPDRY